MKKIRIIKDSYIKCIEFFHKKHKLIPVTYLVLFSLGFIIYFNSFKGEFLIDDIVLIEKNSFIRSISTINNIFTQDIGGGANHQYGYYRPLQIFLYSLIFFFSGLNVIGYHLVNVLLHIITCMLFFHVLLILSKNQWIAVVSSILFVTSPIHVENVSYISGTADILVTLFMLTAFLYFLKDQKEQKTVNFILIIIFFLLAIFSKENAIIFPVLLLIYNFVFKKKFAFRIFVPLFIITFIYFLLRIIILKVHITTVPLIESIKRIPGFFIAIFIYLKSLVFPLGLHLFYNLQDMNNKGLYCALGVLIIIFILGISFKTKKKYPLVTFSLLWFIITLLPSSNIIPVDTFMADRYLYLPSIGFYFFIGIALFFLYRIKLLKAIVIVFLICLISIFCFVTIKQNVYWSNKIFTFKRSIAFSPSDLRLYHGLATIHLQKGEAEKALFYLNEIIEKNPFNMDAYAKLGRAYSALGQTERAIKTYKKIIIFEPDNIDTYNALGNIFANLKKYNEAIYYYKKAIEKDPLFYIAHYNLGRIYVQLNDTSKAIKFYKKALDINPNSFKTYDSLGSLFLLENKNNIAIELYKKAIGINPRYVNAYLNLGIAYQKLEKLDLAKKYYLKTLEIEQKSGVCHNNLAVVYVAMNDYNLAYFHFEKAKEYGYPIDEKLLEQLIPIVESSQ
ncbi:tetratricopeptide repeat protein [Chlamydiota bacterium]